MDIELTLVDKVLNGDIKPLMYKDVKNYEFTEPGDEEISFLNEPQEIAEYWLDSKDLDSVFVCFRSFSGEPYELQNRTILVTNQHFEVSEFIRMFTDVDPMPDEYVEISIFEFESFEEAFKYCTDLKQGL